MKSQPPTGEPSLIVDKTASEETVQVGAPITYTIEVKNDGYSVINNVVVRDTLWTEDTELTATGDVTGTYQVDEDGGKYYISEMKPGETLTITYTYTPTEAGTLTNKVEVTADNLPDGEKPSDEVTVEVTPEPVSSLTVNKSLAQVNGSDYTGGKVSVGDKLTYTIQVTNTGNTTLSRVTVEDSLWNDGDSIQVDGQLAYVADGGTYTIKHEIAPDDMVTITYTYIVLRSDAGDTLTNTATVTTDGGTTGEDTTETPVKPVPPIRPLWTPTSLSSNTRGPLCLHRGLSRRQRETRGEHHPCRGGHHLLPSPHRREPERVLEPDQQLLGCVRRCLVQQRRFHPQQCRHHRRLRGWHL